MTPKSPKLVCNSRPGAAPNAGHLPTKRIPIGLIPIKFMLLAFGDSCSPEPVAGQVRQVKLTPPVDARGGCLRRLCWRWLLPSPSPARSARARREHRSLPPDCCWPLALQARHRVLIMPSGGRLLCPPVALQARRRDCHAHLDLWFHQAAVT